LTSFVYEHAVVLDWVSKPFADEIDEWGEHIADLSGMGLLAEWHKCSIISGKAYDARLRHLRRL